MAEETTEETTVLTPPNPRSTKYWWQGDEMRYKNRRAHKYAEYYYKDAIKNLRILQSELSAIYKETNIQERQLALKKIEVKYGTKDFAKIITDLRKQKDFTYKILTSRYVNSPDANTFEFHNDGTRELGELASVEFRNEDIVIGNNLNTYYNPYYDMDSKETDLAIKKAGVTKEEYTRQWFAKEGFPDDALQFINPKNESAYVDPNDNTDLWGRDPSDVDFGINPMVIAARTDEIPGSSVTEFNDTYGLENENEEIVDDNKDEVTDQIELVSSNEEVTDSNEEVTDSKEEVTETPNRLQFMTTAIEEDPSSIQQHLIDSGFTAERLAKLKIKDQDFQKARGNKELMIKFKKDKALGVYR